MRPANKTYITVSAAKKTKRHILQTGRYLNELKTNHWSYFPLSQGENRPKKKKKSYSHVSFVEEKGRVNFIPLLQYINFFSLKKVNSQIGHHRTNLSEMKI